MVAPGLKVSLVLNGAGLVPADLLTPPVYRLPGVCYQGPGWLGFRVVKERHSLDTSKYTVGYIPCQPFWVHFFGIISASPPLGLYPRGYNPSSPS